MYSIICLAVVLAVFASVFTIAASTSKVAYAAVAKPIQEGSVVEIYPNLDFTPVTGKQTIVVSNQTYNWSSGQLEGTSIRLFAESKVTESSLKIQADNVALDLNGQTISGLLYFSGKNIKLTDLAGGGKAEKLFVEATGSVDVYGTSTTTYSFQVFNGGTITLHSGRIKELTFQQNAKAVNSVLPKGYAFVAYSAEDRYEFYPYENTKSSSFVADGSTIKYLSVKECSHDSITDGVCDYCNANIDSTEALATAKREIEVAKEDLIAQLASQESVGNLANSLNDSIRQANELINSNKVEQDEALQKAISDLQEEIAAAKKEVSDAASAALKTATDELTEKINTKADKAAVDESVKSLNDAITNINTTLTALGAKDTELEGKITAAKKEVSDAASAALKTATDDLTAKINAKADKSAVDESVKSLNDAITNINTTLTALGAKDTELDGKIAKAKDDVANAAQANLDNAVTALTTKIDAKANKADVDESIDELNSAIETINTTLTALGAKDTELDGKIAKAKQDVANAASAALKTATDDLTAKINTKANADEVNESIKKLTAAIENAKTANDKYVEEKNTTLKSDFAAQISEASTTLQDAVDKLSSRLDGAEAQIAKNSEQIEILKKVVTAAWSVMLAFGVITLVMVFGFRRVAKLSVAKTNCVAKANDEKPEDGNADESQSEQNENGERK